MSISKNGFQAYDPMQSYLNDVKRYQLLTREQELELAIRANSGDSDAVYMLVNSNLRLVVKIVLGYKKVWRNWIQQNILDLIQEGNIGLMQAVRKYDPEKNVKLSYYASFWIKAHILKFIMDNWSLVKIGTTQAQRKLFFTLHKEKQKLISKGFNPKPKLISQETGISEREIVNMNQRIEGNDVSIDAPVKSGSDTEWANFFREPGESAEERLAKKEFKDLVQVKIVEFKKRLNQREHDIFERRIFSEQPATLRELGGFYEISRERVRQIEQAILKKLKKFLIREIPDMDLYAMVG